MKSREKESLLIYLEEAMLDDNLYTSRVSASSSPLYNETRDQTFGH